MTRPDDIAEACRLARQHMHTESLTDEETNTLARALLKLHERVEVMEREAYAMRSSIVELADGYTALSVAHRRVRAMRHVANYLRETYSEDAIEARIRAITHARTGGDE
jgi:hypothetical protein